MKLTSGDRILCIDPGTTHSGVVLFDGKNVLPPISDTSNEYILTAMSDMKNMARIKHLAIEGVSSYGMPVGETTFSTVEWIGRFRQAFGFENTTKIYRKDIKMFLCQSMRAKDANIRRRILDIFPATGGGDTPQIGTKSNQGPLYGVTGHCMSALAVGLTYKYKLLETNEGVK